MKLIKKKIAMKNWTLFIIFGAVMLGTSMLGFACMPPPQHQSFIVTLLDAKTGEAINYGQVTVTREYQIECRSKFCPKRLRSWSGESDPSGQVLVPRSLISTSTTIEVQGYQSQKLNRNLLRTPKKLLIKLIPKKQFMTKAKLLVDSF